MWLLALLACSSDGAADGGATSESTSSPTSTPTPTLTPTAITADTGRATFDVYTVPGTTDCLASQAPPATVPLADTASTGWYWIDGGYEPCVADLGESACDAEAWLVREDGAGCIAAALGMVDDADRSLTITAAYVPHLVPGMPVIYLREIHYIDSNDHTATWSAYLDVMDGRVRFEEWTERQATDG